MMIFFVVLLAAALGSFATVLIHRLPLMILAGEADSRINLILPASHCPNCCVPLRFFHNIPLLSFICLKGRCGVCAQSIAWRYLWVELGVVVLAVLCYFVFGQTMTAVGYFVFLYFLWVLAWIDALHYLLPDALTLSLLWAGLLYRAWFTPDQLVDSVLAAGFAYVFLYAVFWAYWSVTKKQGLGFGDMKLLAAVGAWLGLVAVSNVLIGACLLALLFACYARLRKQKSLSAVLPFGPFIALAAFIFLLKPFDFGAFLLRLF